MEKIIHILFDEAGAKNLQAAFDIDPTLQDEVVIMEDDWSVGPLTFGQQGEQMLTREEWMQLNFYHADNEETTTQKKDHEKIDTVISKMQEDDNIHLWIWLAQNTRDVCGYYWLLNQVKDFEGRIEVIYINNLPFLNEQAQLFFPTRLSEIPSKEFPKAKRLAREITPSEMEVDTEEWLRLIEMKSVIRLLEGAKKIKYLPEDIYDKSLLSACSQEWQKANKVLHQLLHKNKEHISEAFLLWRLKELIADGELTYQGELKTKKDFEVKLPLANNEITGE